MMHRSKKPLVSGDREYFNEKRPVNVRVEGTAHLAEALGSCPETGFWEINVRATAVPRLQVEPATSLS